MSCVAAAGSGQDPLGGHEAGTEQRAPLSLQDLMLCRNRFQLRCKENSQQNIS